jgi:hypothetical protein
VDDWPDENGETIPCPHCRHPIHEDSQRCPHCENWISEEDSPPERKPVWIVVTAVICLLIVLLWILGGW